jgi:hypothetical protein
MWPRIVCYFSDLNKQFLCDSLSKLFFVRYQAYPEEFSVFSMGYRINERSNHSHFKGLLLFSSYTAFFL